MVVKPKVRGFICTTAHPDGCREAVKEQIDYVKGKPKVEGAKKVLVIGASTGYGLASRIAACFACDAATIGVMFEKPPVGNRTATAGWYNTAAFEQFAQSEGKYAKTINGDAFSKEVKEETVQAIQKDLGKVDLVVYSLASPRRTMPDGTVVHSVLKTTNNDYTNKTINLSTKELSDITVEQATQQEIDDTVKVMGGEDWLDWIRTLDEAGVLSEHAVTVAYSYIGPELTHAMYLNGSIGMAKKHLYQTAHELNRLFPQRKAYVSVNKALVTQSSAAIPVVPLYISILYKVMKENGTHEGCIQQMYRLLSDRLYAQSTAVDEEGRIRIDDYEMQKDVQDRIKEIWDDITQKNLEKYCDINGYWDDFYKMFGFQFDGISYDEDVNIDRKIPSID